MFTNFRDILQKKNKNMFSNAQGINFFLILALCCSNNMHKNLGTGMFFVSSLAYPSTN